MIAENPGMVGSTKVRMPTIVSVMVVAFSAAMVNEEGLVRKRAFRKMVLFEN